MILHATNDAIAAAWPLLICHNRFTQDDVFTNPNSLIEYVTTEYKI